MSWLLEKVLLKYLKPILDKLPLDGLKTIAGILLIVLGVLLKALPQYEGPIGLFINLLQHLPADPVTDMGVVTLITGVTHKLLKWAGAEK